MTITIPMWFAYALVGLWAANNIVTIAEGLVRWQTARMKRAIAKSEIKREIEDRYKARHPELVEEADCPVIYDGANG